MKPIVLVRLFDEFPRLIVTQNGQIVFAKLLCRCFRKDVKVGFADEIRCEAGLVRPICINICAEFIFQILRTGTVVEKRLKEYPGAPQLDSGSDGSIRRPPP